ncbi:MAG: hypothetical protein JXI33_01845 [Candidatus Aminicenantes bacterium]|nr:hypothetical protein [Candidatus Aminicenantes bacterium]
MKKKLFKIFLLLFGIFLIAIVFSSLSFRQKINRNPLPSYYKKGVYHLHSNFSDGRGTIDEICRDARSQGLDFVILTDHGRPNLQASAATAWLHDVLLIGASEFSLHAGHLAAVGYHVPDYIFPPEAQEAIAEVERDGGVSFIAHPLDRKIPWTNWQVHGFTGIEILSLYQMAKKNLLVGMTFLPLRYLFNADYALTTLISYPEKEMLIWDRFNRAGKYFGIFALDSHAKLQISKNVSLHFPSYGATFRILNLYVKVERDGASDAPSAAAAIISALRRGDFFNVIESLAPANGFENYYREKNGRQIAMGGDAQGPGGDVIFKLPFNFPVDVVVKKDGEIFKTVRSNKAQELIIPITRGGVYRSEISLSSGHFKKLPWIMTNPIYIARPATEAAAAKTLNGPSLAFFENIFQVEKNGASSAAICLDGGHGQGTVTGLAFTLRPDPDGKPDFWVALAFRQNTATAGYHGFVFETSASAPMRCWLQFRTGSGSGEAAYQHSFLATEQWRQVAIPFSNFHRLYGQPGTTAPAAIDAVFFLIDNGNAYPGACGEIFFRQVGLY